MTEPKVCYSYEKNTGAFFGENRARPCPIEEGVWHFPAQTTEVQPQEHPPGQWPKWIGDGWTLVPDHRGETWYRARADGLFYDAMLIHQIGDPAEHGLIPNTLPAPPPAAQSLVKPNGFD